MTESQKTLFLDQSLSEAKKQAWKFFSEYIRRRNADKNGYIYCCSCGKYIHWKQSQAGHWPSIDGRNNSILFSETGVNAQCGQCNTYKNGNPSGYDAFMRKKYGQKEMDRLLKIKHDTVKYEKTDYIRMIEKWQKEMEDFVCKY